MHLAIVIVAPLDRTLYVIVVSFYEVLNLHNPFLTLVNTAIMKIIISFKVVVDFVDKDFLDFDILVIIKTTFLAHIALLACCL